VTAFLANLTGLWLSQTLNSIVSIYITIPLLLIPQILLCGLVIPFSDLKSGAGDDNLVPVIGEIIPSRWAFEALAVEQFTNNAYNRAFFPVEKEKFLAQYYKDVHIPQLRSLNSNEGDHAAKQTVANELALINRLARLDLPDTGEPVSYLEKADSALRVRSHNYTSYLDQIRRNLLNDKGSVWLNELMYASHNEAIEALLTGRGNRFFKHAGHRIYPLVGQIYFDPESKSGRAPFFSHAKRIGESHYPTYGFNIFVLTFFAILAIISIFAEIPGKYPRCPND
jgi:hypothetical protein